MSRPTERLPDHQIFDRAVVKYINTEDSRCPGVPLDKFEAIVLYAEPRGSGMHTLRLVVCKAERVDTTVQIASGAGLAFKNAAIGRRSCPDCWDANEKGRVWDQGAKAGQCKVCGVKVDLMLASLRPYFYYYTADDRADSPVIAGGSRDMYLADELKPLLLTGTAPEILPLPTYTQDGTLMCLDGFLEPVVFSRAACGLAGQSDRCQVGYDFWHHPARASKRKMSERRSKISVINRAARRRLSNSKKTTRPNGGRK